MKDRQALPSFCRLSAVFGGQGSPSEREREREREKAEKRERDREEKDNNKKRRERRDIEKREMERERGGARSALSPPPPEMCKVLANVRDSSAERRLCRFAWGICNPGSGEGGN
jgi:hypothetical protein